MQTAVQHLSRLLLHTVTTEFFLLCSMYLMWNSGHSRVNKWKIEKVVSVISSMIYMIFVLFAWVYMPYNYHAIFEFLLFSCGQATVLWVFSLIIKSIAYSKAMIKQFTITETCLLKLSKIHRGPKRMKVSRIYALFWHKEILYFHRHPPVQASLAIFHSH